MPRPKYSLLPVLVVLFICSYGLMTLLIVEQGSTIQSQHDLIRQLLGDTHELAAMKGKAIRDQALSRQAQSKNDGPVANQGPLSGAPLTQAPLNQAPTTQTPLTQAPSNTPSAQAGGVKTQPNHGKVQRPVPSKPASDLVDVRRNLLSI